MSSLKNYSRSCITSIVISNLFVFFVQSSLNAQTFTPKTAYLGQWAFAPGVAHPPTNSVYIPGVYQFGDIDQFVRYNVTTNTWSVVAGLPATKSEFGSAFNANNRIFFGGGVDQPGTFTNVVWEFIPPATFVMVDNIPNGPASSFSFSVGNCGYVGEGIVAGFGNSNTFYKFNPILPPGLQWSIATAYPGSGDVNCGSGSLNGFGYAGFGRSNPGSTVYNDWWRFDPLLGATGTWTAMTAFPGAPRECPMITSQCNKLILIGGVNLSGANFNDIWEFDPAIGATGTWTFLGTNNAVWGPQNGRYGPAFADYGDSLFFGMGYGASNVNTDWNLFNYCPAPLPVEVANLEADLLENNRVDVIWTTMTEINNDYFEIESSIDGINWELMGRVNGSGNSSTLLSYHLIDESPELGTNYYRLRQVDFDGNYKFLGMTTASIDQTSGKEILVYPNPSYEWFQVILPGNSEIVTYRIFDSFGSEIMSGYFSEEKNQVLTSSMARGMYWVHLDDANHTVVKIIKM